MKTIHKLLHFLLTNEISIKEFNIILFKEYNKSTNDLESLLSLENKKLIKITNKKLLQFDYRKKIKDLFNDLDKQVLKNNIDISDNWIKQYRTLFKKTGKVGAMGDPNSVKKKLEKFKIDYPEYNEDTILKATEKYINSESESNYKYLQRADYFISKENSSKESESRLLIFCEEVLEEKDNSNSVNKMI